MNTLITGRGRVPLIYSILARGLITVRAVGGNALDRVDFGNSTAEAVHHFKPKSTLGTMSANGTNASRVSK